MLAFKLSHFGVRQRPFAAAARSSIAPTSCCFLSTVKLKRPLTDEEAAANKFSEWLSHKHMTSSKSGNEHIPRQHIIGWTPEQTRITVEAAMTTFALHVEARAYAVEGRGYYTIGPCGEEFAGVWGALMEDVDTSALHYRHLASQIARQFRQGKTRHEVILDRARGYVCSALDPITGGRHCALGGGKNDFYVTSTLASQAPSAVGRALAKSISSPRTREVNFVSFGDGSVTNAHFLASKNLAENAAFRKIKCPVLFCITDNDLSISLKGQGWMETFQKSFLMPVFRCDGRDIISILKESKAAFDMVRSTQRPAALLVHNVNRRFGHAATDRQSAYLTQAEIDQMKNDNRIMESICDFAVETSAFPGYLAIQETWEQIQKDCRDAFASATKEPKLDNVSSIASKNHADFDTNGQVILRSALDKAQVKPEERMTMRKCMTKAISEQMTLRKNLVYLGEDVRHGGYYLVTEGLAQQFPSRVIDFPPDETTLIGCAQGFSQRGLIPIVEIPYLKYLDCGADQFFEIALTHWCTNGRQNQGMILRLQGFDKGVFGGNFHTHNSIYLPPGLDMLCYSNGPDWVRGFRRALDAAEKGRIVAILDPTHALNKRHVADGDDAWLFEYPQLPQASNFEDLTMYKKGGRDKSKHRLAVVTYGNGVPDALVVQRQFNDPKWTVDVVDCSYLSHVPKTLEQVMSSVDAVLFADCCKLGQNPFGSYVQKLNNKGLLPKKWLVVAAAETYNPLSRIETFLSQQSISGGISRLIGQ